MSRKTIQDYRELAYEKGLIYLSTDIPKDTKTSGGWFQCRYGHQWCTSTYSRIKLGGDCPHCNGTAIKRIQDYRELAFKRGFIYLSDNIPENTQTPGGYFQCRYGHQWCTSTYNSIKNGSGCPYCVGVVRKQLEDYQRLAIEKGFLYISNDIPINASTPSGLFQCSYGHIFTASYHSILQNRGCVYCSGLAPKQLEDYQRLAIEKGFLYISNDIPINASTPSGLFQCSKIHQFKSSYHSILRNRGCPYCVNKTEAILKEKLSQYFPQLVCQYKPEWIRNPKTNYLMSYDFLITYGNFNIIIELDGEQHFKDVTCFRTSAEVNRKRDIYKMKMANQYGGYVIRLLQVDVLNDRYDYMSCILRTITEIVNSRATQWNYYLTHGREYDEHQRDFLIYNTVDELL